MNIKQIIETLVNASYSIKLIAEQSDVPYMRVYRAYNDGAALTEQEQARIRAFAFIQPVFVKEKL